MTRSHGRPQIERRLAIMSAQLTEPDLGWEPDPADVVDHSVNLPLDGLGRIIGRQGLDRFTERLVEFSISAQVQDDLGRWHEVARVDTAHREVHFHVFSHTGATLRREVLLPIHGPQDVDRGYQVGEKMLIVGWDEHERRWRDGR